MKTTSLIKTLLFTCAVGIFASTAQADEKTDAAVAAAKEWLALVDWLFLDSHSPIWQRPGMEITASSFKLRANAAKGRKAISYQQHLADRSRKAPRSGSYIRGPGWRNPNVGGK